ncbi:MAG: hypothetical protein ICV69_09390 [Thermoleophilaceae bacterium]|nr:hypothetical protein [Thermoleophilaceae bacterium]
MATIALLCPDLLFGSKVQGALRAAGHEVVPPDAPADLLVVDLTADVESRIEAVRQARVPTLGFYSHVEQDVRRSAEAAGIDKVVPRSRMARDGPALVERLLDDSR